MNHIDYSKPFDYSELEKQIGILQNKYSIAQIFSIGNSWEERKLYCIRIGKGPKKLLYVGAHHALEWGTSQVLINYAFELLDSLNKTEKLCGYNTKLLLEKVSLFIVPMLNPDGIELVLNGANKESIFYDRLMKITNNKFDFSNWQANVRGVDLNHNYNAGWLEGKIVEKQNSIYDAGPTRYSGECPESERETQALCEFTRNIIPNIVLAFHSQGEEIYYEFKGKIPPSGEQLAAIFSGITGYKVYALEGIASYGGYKDWFIDEFNLPAFTFEIGSGTNPLPAEEISRSYKKLKEALTIAGFLIK